jgi:hypothetical protein
LLQQLAQWHRHFRKEKVWSISQLTQLVFLHHSVCECSLTLGVNRACLCPARDVSFVPRSQGELQHQSRDLQYRTHGNESLVASSCVALICGSLAREKCNVVTNRPHTAYRLRRLPRGLAREFPAPFAWCRPAVYHTAQAFFQPQWNLTPTCSGSQQV